jgi:hypothetical protein
MRSLSPLSHGDVGLDSEGRTVAADVERPKYPHPYPAPRAHLAATEIHPLILAMNPIGYTPNASCIAVLGPGWRLPSSSRFKAAEDGRRMESREGQRSCIPT